MSELEKCPACGGLGYLKDVELEEFIGIGGNSYIRFKPVKLNCPNPKCKSGFIMPDEV